MNADLLKARRHLARRDAILKHLIREVGPCTLKPEPDGFAVLARSIISQQISTKAAQSIAKRLVETVTSLRPSNVLKASEEDLRSAGLSANKCKALRDLAQKCLSNEIPLKKLADMDNEEVIECLLPVHGIGRWTAEMFLIFSLGRPDILPVADFGLRAGVKKHYQLAEMPTKEGLTGIAEPWRPYRSIATWFIWRGFGAVPQSS